MKKILITIKDNTITFKEKKKLNTEYKSLLNTNVISANELLFSDEYIIENTKIVATFINELTTNFNIDTVIVDDSSFLLIVLSVLKNNKSINTLIISDDIPLTFKACEMIIKTNIQSINCYTLQPFMIEYLDKYNILVESRNELLFMSKFMIQNNLNQFSSIYYKVSLQIEFPLSAQDEEDFIAFAKLNNYLKVINVTTVCKDDLEFIIKTLKKANRKNIKIVINNDITDIETINYLRNYNKKYSKRYKIYFKLVYSNKYLKENFLKQTNSSLLETCGYIIIIIIFLSFLFVFYDNYKSMQNVNEIQENLTSYINDNKDKEEIEIKKKQMEELIAQEKEKNNNSTTTKNENKEEKEEINLDILTLMDLNSDTVGWLKVNNTNIDYPVLKTTDNAYYLKHNIYKKYDTSGWVFMDYRDDVINLSDNIIIYAHNRYHNGVMFGTLQNTFRKTWYTNPDNQIIELKTINKTYKYQVFSIYKIQVTSDYLRTVFNNNEKKEFFNMLKNRSIYNFGIELNNNDKIITLSTCADDENRYVLHAVLLKDE